MVESKTGAEIADQYVALEKTCRYFMEQSDKIKAFMKGHQRPSWVFIGCGSGYALCIAGAAVSTRTRARKQLTHAFPAGDLLVNFPEYVETIKDSLFIIPSRSGTTSEVLKCVELAKSAFKTNVVSICTRENATLSAIADLDLSLPWAFDESTCQTRTVSNLYGALLLFAAIVNDDQDLLDEIMKAVNVGSSFIAAYTKPIHEFTRRNAFSRVVVLADADLEGIAREGMLAFIEIARVPANYFHVLDARHGPLVLIDNDTLVIVACSAHNVAMQVDLVADLKRAGATIVTVSDQPENVWNADLHVVIPPYKNMSVRGLPLIYVIQELAYATALKKNIDPDNPPGLKPWIQLKL